jgi:hypothetical protein
MDRITLIPCEKAEAVRDAYTKIMKDSGYHIMKVKE